MSKPPIIEAKIQQAQITRSDVADVRRSIQTLANQANRIKDSLNQQLTNTNYVDVNTTTEIIRQRNDLNEVNEQISNLSDKLNKYLPSNSNARLNETEQREIQAFYSSGRYTQKDLAEQYGVNQSTISDIVNKSK